MDREELRFRLTCEARKIAGRVRLAIRPPQWDRADVAGALDPGAGPLVARAVDAARRHNYLAAHRALGEHFRTRASVWPLRARARAELAGQIRDRFPDAARAARVRADRIVDGRHDLLGYRNVPLGNPPDWHADAIHGRSAPLAHWAAVPYLDPASGDHKIIWETNRHQYFLALGSAYWLTGDRRYRDTFIGHVEDWLCANPPLLGVNWSSMLEIAFRALSWTSAVEFFAADSDTDENPWLVDLLVSLDRQLTHVAHNLSSYFSPNTHLSGEALALYAVSTAFPELRRSRARAAAGRDVLLREADNQVRADGGHAELSAHYHRYSTDFYLLALMVARASNDAAAAAFDAAARKQAHYLRTIADDQGRLPLLGDDDGGQLFKFGEGAPADAAVSLGVAADLLHDDTLCVAPVSADTLWILGRPPASSSAIAVTATGWPSRLLPESGYFVSRMAGGGHLVFDAGPHGFLNGGHAHADALAVVLTAGGEPLLIDPGTATYTMDPTTRDRFRSSRMHNTLVLDGQDHAIPAGPFHWRTRAESRFLVARTGREVDFAIGTRDDHGPLRHMRAVLALHGIGWLIVDRVITDRPTAAEIFWHLHPAWSAAVHDSTACPACPELRRRERSRGAALVHRSGRPLALATTAQDLSQVHDPALSLYAPEYGRIEPATTLVARHAAAAPFAVGTFVPAVAAAGRVVAIAEIAADTRSTQWASAAFAIRSGDDEIHVSVDFPPGLGAQPPELWPQPCIMRLEVSRTH
jgi:hypothetical protein